jgi:hypothetical protein
MLDGTDDPMMSCPAMLDVEHASFRREDDILGLSVRRCTNSSEQENRLVVIAAPFGSSAAVGPPAISFLSQNGYGTS